MVGFNFLLKFYNIQIFNGIDIGSNCRNLLKCRKEVVIFLIYDVPFELNTYRLVNTWHHSSTKIMKFVDNIVIKDTIYFMLYHSMYRY